MKLTYSELKSFDDRLDQILASQAVLLADNAIITTKIGLLMAKIDEVMQNLDDMGGLVDQFFDLITARDAENAALKQQVLDLTAGDTALQAKISAAFDKSEATENKMRAKIPGVPPVGGTALLPSYADRAAFDAAVLAYTGPEGVTVDSVSVKTGTTPSIDYYMHSASGAVDTSGPTD